MIRGHERSKRKNCDDERRTFLIKSFHGKTHISRLVISFVKDGDTSTFGRPLKEKFFERINRKRASFIWLRWGVSNRSNKSNVHDGKISYHFEKIFSSYSSIWSLKIMIGIFFLVSNGIFSTFMRKKHFSISIIGKNDRLIVEYIFQVSLIFTNR